MGLEVVRGLPEWVAVVDFKKYFVLYCKKYCTLKKNYLSGVVRSPGTDLCGVSHRVCDPRVALPDERGDRILAEADDETIQKFRVVMQYDSDNPVLPDDARSLHSFQDLVSTIRETSSTT